MLKVMSPMATSLLGVVQTTGLSLVDERLAAANVGGEARETRSGLVMFAPQLPDLCRTRDRVVQPDQTPDCRGYSASMVRILLTGVSGTGKSTVITELTRLGYKAVDLDCDEFSEWIEVVNDVDEYGSSVEPGRDWVWREDRVRTLLDAPGSGILFVSGCAANMGKFLDHFDAVILLSATRELMAHRLGARTNNHYGKRPEEAERALELKDSVEPMLRKIAHHEIITERVIEATVSKVLEIAERLT